MLTQDGFYVNAQALGKMSDQEFYQFCQDNDHLRIERDCDFNITIMAPTGTNMGRWNNRLATDITNWCDINNQALVFDSSTGFKLKNGAVRSPDVSVIAKNRWENYAREEEEIFATIVPDFVIEIRSRSEDLHLLEKKMREYLDNEIAGGWLIDPYNKQVKVYQVGKSILLHNDFSKPLSAQGILHGLTINLKEVFK